MRYLSQRDTFRCAAIAVINALKWKGIRATLADAKALADKWGLSRETPASCLMVQRFLKVKGKELTEQQVFDAVSKGHAVIINTWYTGNCQWRGHVWFCPGLVQFNSDPVGYFGVNVYQGENQSLVSRREMAELLRFAFVWVIKRTGRPSTV